MKLITELHQDHLTKINTMLWAVGNSSVHLMIFLFCLSYQYHALLASAVPSNYTASDILYTTSVHGRGVTNTTVTKNDGVSVDFLERGVPLLSRPSKAKTWPAVDDLSSSTRHYRVVTSKAHGDDPVAVPCRDNCTSHRDVVSPRNRIPSFSVPLITSNGSTNLRLPPIHRQVQRRVQHPRRKRRGVIKVRKLLGAYHHPTRLPSDHTGTGTAVIAIGSVLSILVCAIAGILLWCMRSNPVKSTAINLEVDEPILRSELHRLATGPRRYSYTELAAATSNFAQGKRIGRGGFGSVYCGYIDEQDRHVAVKLFSKHSLEEESMEFEAEVKIMSQLRHRNVVQLVGWCDSRKGLLLVYELVSGGSLDKQLYDPEKVLTWQERYKIALGLCSAIQYLHMDCNQCVLHGDIKPSNIMLDSSNNAKLGDFRLARLVDHGAESQTTQVVAGTIGYIDPEFVSSQKRGTESDIYSFGIVLLEIACGRRPTALGQSVEATMLLKCVRYMYDRNRILDAADVRLGGNFEGNQMECVLLTGLWCAHHDKGQRPSIAQVMSALRCENCAELPVLSAMHSPGQIHHMEEQAYRDLSTESSWSMCLSTVTAYHTAEPSTLHAQQ